MAAELAAIGDRRAVIVRVLLGQQRGGAEGRPGRNWRCGLVVDIAIDVHHLAVLGTAHMADEHDVNHASELGAQTQTRYCRESARRSAKCRWVWDVAGHQSAHTVG